MNANAGLSAVRMLVVDTFRQARSGLIFWVMLAVTAVAVLTCLGVGLAGTATSEPEVRRLQFHLADWGGDTAGLVLVLVFTAGFLPTFLEPRAASVLLAKPVPRWAVLLGKYLGVMAFLTVQTVLFVGGTWLALGLSTGVWSVLYWWSVPLALLYFAVFFAFSAFLAVSTRSTVSCVFGSVLFWLVCWGMNYGRNELVRYPLEGVTPFLRVTSEVGYWVAPKPADLGFVLFGQMRADEVTEVPTMLVALQAKGAFHPELAVFTSLLFAVAILAAAGWQLTTTDY